MKATENSRATYAQAKPDEVLDQLHTSKAGLSQTEAAKRLTQYGQNSITKAAESSQLKVFLKNFVSLMAILLWVSGAIAILSGTLELGIAIWLVNVINGVFSFWQEHKAKKANDS